MMDRTNVLHIADVILSTDGATVKYIEDETGLSQNTIRLYLKEMIECEYKSFAFEKKVEKRNNQVMAVYYGWSK